MTSQTQLNPDQNGSDGSGTQSTWRTRIGGAGLPVAAVLAVAALIAAIVFAALFSYRWYDDTFTKEPVQTARDDALGGAEQVMLNVLSIDLKDSKAYQDRLNGSLTGAARSQILGSTGLGALIKAAGDPSQAATLKAKVLRSAVVELDTDDHTAKTLVFLEVTPVRAGQTIPSQVMGFQVEVTRDGSTWKANNIQPLDSIAVDPTSPTTGGTAAAPAASGAAPAPATSAAPAAPAPTTGAGN